MALENADEMLDALRNRAIDAHVDNLPLLMTRAELKFIVRHQMLSEPLRKGFDAVFMGQPITILKASPRS